MLWSMRARLLVGADGLRSTVRRQLGAERSSGRRVPRYGVRRHYWTAPWSDLVEVYWHEQGEIYVTPVGSDCVGLAVLSRGRPVGHAEALDWFPELRERLTGARADRPRGAGPLEQRVTRVLAPGVALVGDAAGYVDAISGEGLSLGFRGAACLVRRYTSGALQKYSTDHAGLMRSYRLMTRAMLWLSARPRWRRRALRLLSGQPALFRQLLAAAAG